MKVIVAYSGGLDTSVIVKWVKETYNAEVVGFCADVGQEEELDGVEEKAIKTGATKCYVEDLNEEFARDFIFPMMQANAIYEGTYLLGTSIARPLIGKRLIEIARAEGADAICHGATGKGNDQIRFELTAYAFEPGIKIIAPWREWEFNGRMDLCEYAAKHGIPVTTTAEKSASNDMMQGKLMGWLCVAYGAVLVSFAIIIPNAIDGRACFFFGGSAVVGIGGLLYFNYRRIKNEYGHLENAEAKHDDALENSDI